MKNNENAVRNIENDLRKRANGADYISILLISDAIGKSPRRVRDKLEGVTRVGKGVGTLYRIPEVARALCDD